MTQHAAERILALVGACGVEEDVTSKRFSQEHVRFMLLLRERLWTQRVRAKPRKDRRPLSIKLLLRFHLVS